MAIQPNRFNDPALGQAFSNLASIFAPPSAQDLVGYTTARAKREEADRLAWLFENASDPLADRKATMAGVYTPAQSFYAVDTADATARRGQDVTANTTLEKARIDGRFGLANTFMTPLDPGQVQPGLPGSVAGAFGVPAMPRTEGMPKPLSETEQKAAERQRLQSNGSLTDTMLLDMILAEQGAEKTVNAQGQPVFTGTGTAIRTGAPAYVQTGSEAAPEVQNYRAPDGTGGTAMFDRQTSNWRDTQTGQPIPAGSQTFRAGTTGAASDALNPTNSNLTQSRRIRADVTSMNGLVSELENTIRSQAGSAGMAATVQSFAQDSQQVVKELAAALGNDPNAIVDGATLQEVSQRVLGDDRAYNPTFRRVRAMLLDLAYMNARLNNPSGEVSRFALEREMEALGLGLTGNDQSVLASVGVARQRMERALRAADVLDGAAAGPTAADVRGGAASVPGTPTAPPAGGTTRMRFDQNGNPIP